MWSSHSVELLSSCDDRGGARSPHRTEWLVMSTWFSEDLPPHLQVIQCSTAESVLLSGLFFNNNVYKQLQSLLVLSFLLCSQQSNHQLLISHQPHSAFFLSDARVTVESLLTDEKERQKYEDQSRESSFSTFTSMTESCLFKDLKRNTCLYEHTQAVSVCVCVCAWSWTKWNRGYNLNLRPWVSTLCVHILSKPLIYVTSAA